ncbi:hypothetical protein M1328_00715 [Patescibacteria group bacterium]|nr:hypothetical protein [Patescibacteria group bacterium]
MNKFNIGSLSIVFFTILIVLFFLFKKDTTTNNQYISNTPSYSDEQIQEFQQGKAENDDNIKSSVYDACSRGDINTVICGQAINTCSNNDSCLQMVNQYQVTRGEQETQPTRYTFLEAATIYINQQRNSLGLPLIDSNGNIIQSTSH